MPRLRKHLRAPVLLLVLLIGFNVRAAVSVNSPEMFFNSVADRLLQQQLGLRLHEVQVAPTNHYSAAVHRIFQVTANIFEATTTNATPTVFRPLFQSTEAGVYLAGFTNDNAVATLPEWMVSNPYGLPLVIAARKGIPNFNEFTLRTDVLVQRRLQLTRPSIHQRPLATNQMYVLSLSNFFGVEAWNASAYRYPRDLNISVVNAATITLSNAQGLQTNVIINLAVTTNIPANTWRGGHQPLAFQLPLFTNQVALRDAVYRFSDNTFSDSNTNIFEETAGFPVPYSVLSISNHLTYLLGEGDHILDFVVLNAQRTTDLHRDFIAGVNPYQFHPWISSAALGLWSTNREAVSGPTEGVQRQLDIALGNIPIPHSEWAELGLSWMTSFERQTAINQFRQFCGLAPLAGTSGATNNSLSMLSPFNPAAKVSIQSLWEVNDPLVHYHRADFAESPVLSIHLKPITPATNVFPSSLGRFNNSHAPWGGNPMRFTDDPCAFDRSLRDPGVYSSDHWQIPSNAPLRADWLGAVHRGTPWQTIYLKADVAPLSAWTNIVSDLQMHPTNDWRMAALLAWMFNTNDVRELTSINAGEAVWRNRLVGLTVLSNTTEYPFILEPVTFEPAQIESGAPQLSTLWEALERHRTMQSGQYLRSVADLFAIPEFSSRSPWLNLADADQVQFGLNDAAYEVLPSQLLARIRPDPIVDVIRRNGEVLVHVTAFPGFTYQLESSSDAIFWVPMGGPVFSEEGTFTKLFPATETHQFIRVSLLP